MTQKQYDNDDFADFDQRLKDIEAEINSYPVWLLGKSTIKRGLSIVFHSLLIGLIFGYLAFIIISIIFN